MSDSPTSRSLSFMVLGKPIPQGSKSVRMRGGKPVSMDQQDMKTKTLPSGRLKNWKGKVSAEASKQFVGEPWRGPIELECVFWFPRVKTHYTGKGALKKGAPVVPRGDLDKLVRAVGDALTKVIYHDDVQIVSFGRTTKRFAQETHGVGGVDVTVREL